MQVEVENKNVIETVEKEGISKFHPNKRRIVEENVKKIILENEETSKNDLLLCIEYWKFTHQISVRYNKDEILVSFDKNKLGKMTAPESISRARRQLKRDGEIDYDEETESSRKKLSVEARTNYKRTENYEFEDKETEGVF